MVSSRGAVRFGIVLLGGVAFALAGYVLFLVVPATMADVAGVVLALLAVVVGLRLAGNLAITVAPPYDVAEVAVEGPITRSGGGGTLPANPRSVPVDDVVEQIERADEDGAVEALLVRLNTPGGEVVPSDDVKRAVERFDGPTVGYATDTCASGGYWIASGCDEFWARELSVVGSIGVLGSRLNAAGLADRLGLSYEQFTAGEYKDAGVPLRELDDDERAYLQGIVDDVYDHFVERVSDGRDLSADAVEETEARIYLGDAALERGLVDDLGTRDDVEDAIASRLDRDEVTVEPFEPRRSLARRLEGGVARVGLSVASVLASGPGDDAFSLRTERR